MSMLQKDMSKRNVRNNAHIRNLLQNELQELKNN